jgi:prepilin-type N-terminal cleavage/methylation domain-containing protein
VEEPVTDRAHPRRGGYTLIEIMVAIVIISILLGLGVSILSRLRSTKPALESARDNVMATMRRARNHGIATRTAAEVVLVASPYVDAKGEVNVKAMPMWPAASLEWKFQGRVAETVGEWSFDMLDEAGRTVVGAFEAKTTIQAINGRTYGKTGMAAALLDKKSVQQLTTSEADLKRTHLPRGFDLSFWVYPEYAQQEEGVIIEMAGYFRVLCDNEGCLQVEVDSAAGNLTYWSPRNRTLVARAWNHVQIHVDTYDVTVSMNHASVDTGTVLATARDKPKVEMLPSQILADSPRTFGNVPLTLGSARYNTFLCRVDDVKLARVTEFDMPSLEFGFYVDSDTTDFPVMRSGVTAQSDGRLDIPSEYLNKPIWRIRFEPDGSLDPRYHTQPMLLVIRTDGDAGEKAQSIRLTIGQMGIPIMLPSPSASPRR